MREKKQKNTKSRETKRAAEVTEGEKIVLTRGNCNAAARNEPCLARRCPFDLSAAAGEKFAAGGPDFLDGEDSRR